MAKTKAELLKEATELGLEIDKSTTISVIKAMIADAAKVPATKNTTKSDEKAEDKVEAVEEVTVAKAGKRSAKALKEAEAEQAKEERKASGEAAVATPKAIQKPGRPKIERRGKGFQNSAKKIEKGKSYPLDAAIELARTTSHVKFDATVELHVNLNVDPKHADQNIRDNILLPAGNGKKVRVAVFSDDPKSALAAGADIAGSDDFLQLLDKGKFDFDILISSPTLMAKLGKYARSLGPRGLMPNPKSGTVTNDIDKAIAEAKAGRVEYRVDSNGIIHLGIGKVSFSAANLNDNILAVIASIRSNKPTSVKSGYLKAVHLATSMGPSINVDLANLG